MMNNNFNQQNDYQSKIDAFYDNEDKNQLERLRQKYSTVPNYKNMSLRDELQTRFDLKQMNNLEQKFGQEEEKCNMEEANDSYRYYINKYFPSTFVQSYDVLKKAKDEMDFINTKNSDNYYHSIAMCENAQAGRPISSLVLGGVKEGIDLYKKIKQNDSIGEILVDGLKDMGNNIRGVYYGLKYPERNCRNIFANLDWNTNRMK